MATGMQVIRGARRAGKPARRSSARALDGRPFRSGVVISIFDMGPKKPNSANRKVAKTKLSNGRIIPVYIPGEGHNLQPHSRVLVSGGRRNDLPSVRHKVVRGARGYDCAGVSKRKQSRSKYGCKKAV